jgi:hypothetical protein
MLEKCHLSTLKNIGRLWPYLKKISGSQNIDNLNLGIPEMASSQNTPNFLPSKDYDMARWN